MKNISLSHAFILGYAFALGYAYGRRHAQLAMDDPESGKTQKRDEHGKFADEGKGYAGGSSPVTLKREARSHADVRSVLYALVNKPLTSADGLTATLSITKADKIMSGKAIKKSVSTKVHQAAAANIDFLFAASKEGNDSEKGDSPGIKAFRRFYAPFRFEGKIYQAKISAREHESAKQGNRIYTIEAMDVER